MHPFEIGGLAALAAAVVVRWLAPPRDRGARGHGAAAGDAGAVAPGDRWAGAERGRDLGTPGVFVAAAAGLLVRAQRRDPTWLPHGADWDSWLQSAMAIGHDAPYPSARWPAWAVLAGGFDALVPGPAFRDVAVFSLLCTALAAAGVYRLLRTLVGAPAGLAAAALVATSPVVVQIGGWCSSYSAWLAAVIWAVAGLVEAARGGRARWWAVAGLAGTLVAAIMAKGLGIALMLGPLAIGAWLLRGSTAPIRPAPDRPAPGPPPARRARWRNGAALAGPFAAIALLYVLWPTPLMPLEEAVERIEAVRRPGSGPPGSGPPGSGPPGSGGARAADTGEMPPGEEEWTTQRPGYVFGRSMAPWTVVAALRTAGQIRSTANTRDRDQGGVARLRQLYPTVGPASVVLWLAAPAIGLVCARRRWRIALLGWLGLGAVVAGTAPALVSEFNIRFGLPLYALAAGLWVVPAAALVADRRRPWRWLALALPLLALLPGSPWRQAEHVDVQLKPVEFRGDVALRLYHEMRREHPETPLEILAPPRYGLLLLEGRDATLQRDVHYEDDPDIPLRAGRHVLAVAPADLVERPGFGVSHTHLAPPACLTRLRATREVVDTLDTDADGTPLVLFGPERDAEPPR